MNYTLKSFNTGQVTLPKKWRDKFETKHFSAEETPQGLLIRPMNRDFSDTVYYENTEGFGVYSESGMSPEKIIEKIKLLQNG